MKRLRWCLHIKDGIKIRDPNENVSRSYVDLAKSSLKSAELMLNSGNLLWSTVMIYYAEYYALYSFLSRIGVKCENHFCSILLGKFLLGEEEAGIIESHRKVRVDAQYYLKIRSKKEIREMFIEAKKNINNLIDLTLNLTEDEIRDYRKKIFELEQKI